MSGEIRYTCVAKGCGMNTIKDSAYCEAHRPGPVCGYPVSSLPGDFCTVAVPCERHQATANTKGKIVEGKIAEKAPDRSPVESDAIHLLKQAVRRLENGDRQNAERYAATACVLMGIGVDLNQP